MSNKIYISPEIDKLFSIKIVNSEELKKIVDEYKLNEIEYIDEVIPTGRDYQIKDDNLNITEEFNDNLDEKFMEMVEEDEVNLDKIIVLSKIFDIIPSRGNADILKAVLKEYNENTNKKYGEDIERYINILDKYINKGVTKKKLVETGKVETQKVDMHKVDRESLLLFSQGKNANRLSTMEHFILPNRKLFPLYIKGEFQAGVSKYKFNPIKLWDEDLNKYTEKMPFEQQKFVSYYLSEYTPYRGLLLYHGLGSGKTGASIMVAEGFRNRRIVILLPASLHSNYLNEIERFGEVAYKKNFYWEFIELPYNSVIGRLEPHVYKEMNDKGIDNELLDSILTEKGGKKGIYMVDYSKESSNYDEMGVDDKVKLNKQINGMINWKYTILHYNAGASTIPNILKSCLSKDKFEKMVLDLKLDGLLTREAASQMLNYIFNPLNNVENPFDNKVVIIDEIHNITSKLLGSGYVMTFIYELIIRSKNSRLVFLSGTPMINSSYELGLLFNMLNGYIYEYTLNIGKKTGYINPQEITLILSGSPYIDRFSVDVNTKTVSFTLVPIEFNNVYKMNKYDGIKKSEIIGDMDMISKIELLLKSNNYEIMSERATIRKFTLFPDILRHETAYALINKKMPSIKLEYLMGTDRSLKMESEKLFNTNKFYRDTFKDRIQGYVSFYNEIAGIDKLTGYNLFPDKINASNEETEVIMSDYQYIDYCRYRKKEQDEEEKSLISRFINIARASRGAMDFGDIPNSFRVYTRQSGIFVFPPHIRRPTRRISEEDKVYTQEELYNKVSIIMKNVDKKNAYEKIIELLNDIVVDNIPILVGVLKIMYPNNTSGYNTVEQFKDIMGREEGIKLENPRYVEELDEKGYEDAIRKAIKRLDGNNLRPKNELSEDDRKIVSNITLDILSPKYVKILENINKTEGLVMCYSQYRSVEGIELLSRVLVNNGYSKFGDLSELRVGLMVRYNIDKKDNWITGRITRIEGNDYYIGDKKYRKDELYICKYALWTGTESVDEREMILNAFNGDDNMYGQRCLILMITQSGAEGISLFNVRQVHILEPYWNNVRIQQVIGRARRIRSHIKLPKEKQNVKVYQYKIKFSEEQKKRENNVFREVKNLIGIDNYVRKMLNIGEESRMVDYKKLNDEMVKSEGDMFYNSIKEDEYKTTDEFLDELSAEKDIIVKIYSDMMKEVSIDCEYNKEDNIRSDPKLKSMVCYQNLKDIQTNPYIYDYNITSLKPKQVMDEIAVIPEKVTTIIPFKYGDKHVAVKITKLSEESQVSGEDIKAGMEVYEFDSRMNKIVKDRRGKDIRIGVVKQNDIKEGKRILRIDFN